MAKDRLLKKKITRLHREGDLGKIIEYFLNPLLKYRPEGMETRDFLDLLFGAGFREINRYRAFNATQIKGTSITRHGVKADNFGYRTIKPGDVLYVRTDTRTPNVIDVEVMIGQGRRSRVFRLSALQWAKLKQHLQFDDSNS